MKVKDCVSLSMKVLGYVLDNNPEGYRYNLCEIFNGNNFNRCYLGVDKDGFYIEEHKQFNGTVTLAVKGYEDSTNTNRIKISPHYALRLLFEKESAFTSKDGEKYIAGEYVPKTNYSMRFGLSEIIRYMNVSENELSGCLGSYSRIVDLISQIRVSQDKGEKYPITYMNLKKELDKIYVKDASGIAARIKTISHMSYEDVACIRLRKPDLARILAIMDQIEKQLIDAGRHIAVNRIVEKQGGDSSLFDDLYEKIDLATVLNTDVRNWNEFCTYLYDVNYASILEQNNRYIRNMDGGLLTTFGLDMIPMSGAPGGTRKRS